MDRYEVVCSRTTRLPRSMVDLISMHTQNRHRTLREYSLESLNQVKASIVEHLWYDVKRRRLVIRTETQRIVERGKITKSINLFNNGIFVPTNLLEIFFLPNL